MLQHYDDIKFGEVISSQLQNYLTKIEIGNVGYVVRISNMSADFEIQALCSALL